MTTLYRSPTLIVDDHEWHLVVTIAHPRGRPIKQYLWRPLSAKRFMWSPITEWIGPKPKRLGYRLRKYDRHAVIAMDAERVRLERVQELGRKRPNGAVLRNPGALAISDAKCQNTEILSLPETGVNPVPRGGLRVTCAKMSAEGHTPNCRGRQGFESLTTVCPLS